jgi:murein DD-endopeptidase MepM/ murein hydrolase activator NlpD
MMRYEKLFLQIFNLPLFFLVIAGGTYLSISYIQSRRPVPAISPVSVHSNENKSVTISPPSVRTLLSWPLSQGTDRTKILTFGLYVTPATSPLPKPEKWVGYHTALDLEILPGEENTDVPVLAACDGKIVFAGPVNGYGSALIQSCRIQGNPVMVLYGHLSGSSIKVHVGDTISVGARLALLGKAYENGNVRKHLHFEIHQGNRIEFRGYVPKKTDLLL